MAAVQTLPELLETLTTSLNTLSSTLPSEDSIKPPADGISLLDTKNELLLAYLQNLVFLILLKLRNTKSQIASTNNDDESNDSNPTNNEQVSNNNRLPADEIVQRLVELRLYLERGVKPLENKLRYQIDRAVRAADDYEARTQQQQQQENVGNKSTSKSRAAKVQSSDASSAEDDDAASDVESVTSASSSASSGSDSLGPISRPNLASFKRPTATASSKKTSESSVYKPPRIAPTAPPTASQVVRPQRQRKSYLLDDYVSNELSSAPIAEPSIGTNIVDRGRRDVLSVRERTVAAERQRYEEENLVRLPGMGKKEKRLLQGDRMRRGQFGGEEWSGLGGSAERIVDLVRKKGGKGVLERSRKREREEGGGGGGGLGAAFEKKRKLLEQRRKQ